MVVSELLSKTRRVTTDMDPGVASAGMEEGDFAEVDPLQQ
jgi:hypothetical protein